MRFFGGGANPPPPPPAMGLWWCFGFGETYPNEKYEIKKNLCTKKNGGSKCVCFGPLKMGWPSADAIFENQDKKT